MTTKIEARGHGKVMKGGLGSFGHGRMWSVECESDAQNPDYELAEFAPWVTDEFGCFGDDEVPRLQVEKTTTTICPQCSWTVDGYEGRAFYEHFVDAHLDRSSSGE